MTTTMPNHATETEALADISSALSGLDEDAARRVLGWAVSRFLDDYEIRNRPECKWNRAADFELKEFRRRLKGVMAMASEDLLRSLAEWEKLALDGTPLDNPERLMLAPIIQRINEARQKQGGGS